MVEADPRRSLTACWLDSFQLPNFRGHYRRLLGPSRWEAIRYRTGGWGTAMQSAMVGPGAYVRLWASNDGDRMIWLIPRQIVPNFAAGKLLARVDSIEILDRPPRSRDTGYRAFTEAMKGG